MATMNVSLPDEMKEWVEAQAANGRFANVSDYIRDVVRRDRNGKALSPNCSRLSMKRSPAEAAKSLILTPTSKR